MQHLNILLRQQHSKPHGFVYISFYTNREKVSFSTGIKCLFKDWDEAKSVVLPTDPSAKDKNLLIDNYRAECVRIIVDYRLAKKTLTKKQFMSCFRNADSDHIHFHPYWQKKQRMNTRNLSNKTVASQRSVMKKFEKHFPDLEFADITYDLLQDYKSYLLRKRKNKINTVHRNFAVIGKFIRRAMKDGYIKDDPFEGLEVPTATPDYIFLTEEELTTLVQHYKRGKLTEQQHEALEIFLFLCFAGVHIGDARTIKIEHFTESHLIYYRVKNKYRKYETVSVPISKSLRWIADILIDGRQHGYLLNEFPTDQTIRILLKEIAKQVKIPKNITTKTGRHTFATIYLDKTKDLNALKDILGHSNIRETLIYAHVLEKTKSRNIECFDIFIS